MQDLISRQAAIDKINEQQRKLIYCFGFENDMVKIMDIAKSIVIATPPAQPELSDEEKRLIKQLRSYHNGSYATVIDKLIASAQPMRKRGTWLQDDRKWICSECGELVIDDDHNFCPNCGADMREPE